MKGKLGKRQIRILIALCWAAYAVAYIGRLNYNASLVEIIANLGSTKEAAGLVSSFFFFAYGAGQLIHGILSRRYNTKYAVSLALIVSAVINVLMPTLGTVGAMKYLWFANGVFQSILWCSLIKTISEYVEGDDLAHAVVVMSTPVAAGTFGAYGLAALLSFLKIRWTVIFYIAGALLALVGVLWFAGMRRFEQYEKVEKELPAQAQEGEKRRLSPVFIVFAGVLLLTAIANGFIKDGVTTWVPSVLKESFGMPASLSIIVTLTLPLLSIIGAKLVTTMHKRQKDANVLDGIFYLASTILIGVIMATLGLKFAPLTLVLFGLVAAAMSAINNVITSIVPLYAKLRIPAGTLAGLLNTFCYIGSTLSITLLGHIADASGWNSVFITILIFSAAAFVLCMLSVVTEKIKKE